MKKIGVVILYLLLMGCARTVTRIDPHNRY
ncbi:MAG: hypothetical protein KatS3mg032_0224 [Cyclobacteriaceae bacterium]|nr:MAG: hypothetical protein KatS3mg032_0224 [Cyclobacteriaceae bacterium]